MGMLTLAADRFFSIANYAEAGLWIVVALVFVAVAIRGSRPGRGRCLVAAVAFFCFGLSDVVEG